LSAGINPAARRVEDQAITVRFRTFGYLFCEQRLFCRGRRHDSCDPSLHSRSSATQNAEEIQLMLAGDSAGT
jgi:hypothetical protein